MKTKDQETADKIAALESVRAAISSGTKSDIEARKLAKDIERNKASADISVPRISDVPEHAPAP